MEFMFPVRLIGTRHIRVFADDMQQALEIVNREAETYKRYESKLVDNEHQVLAPVLMLTDEEKATWPYWQFGYYGNDACDWRVGYTDKGIEAIPDFAEESHPVPENWVSSWS